MNCAEILQDRGPRTRSSKIGKHSIELRDYGCDDAHARTNVQLDVSTNVHPIFVEAEEQEPSDDPRNVCSMNTGINGKNCVKNGEPSC